MWQFYKLGKVCRIAFTVGYSSRVTIVAPALSLAAAARANRSWDAAAV